MEIFGNSDGVLQITSPVYLIVYFIATFVLTGVVFAAWSFLKSRKHARRRGQDLERGE